MISVRLRQSLGGGTAQQPVQTVRYPNCVVETRLAMGYDAPHLPQTIPTKRPPVRGTRSRAALMGSLFTAAMRVQSVRVRRSGTLAGPCLQIARHVGRREV